MTQDDKNAIQELIWDLRNEQSNSTPAQRVILQREIERLQSIMDKG